MAQITALNSSVLKQNFLLLGRLWLRGRVVVLQPEGRQFHPSLPGLHAEVSLGKMLNPEFPLIEKKSAANRCTVWICVWMGEWQTGL